MIRETASAIKDIADFATQAARSAADTREQAQSGYQIVEETMQQTNTLVDRVRYISAPSDHLMLVLLLAIAASGLTMTFVAHTDVVMVKQFFRGLMTFNWSPLPADFFVIVHLLLVALLMLVFPFSKLLHAPGIFFSPSRNQVDNPREKRHIAAWARKLEES